MDQYIKEIYKYSPLTRKEEQTLFPAAKAGNRFAYEQIINCNLRFVVSIAKKYQGQGIELNDLIAEGNIGLMKAYEKFDISKNFKFITYAVWWIRQSILNAIHEHAKTIRLPLNKLSNLTKVRKLKDHLEQEFSRSISNEELMQYTNDPDLLEDLQYQYNMVDLDKPMDGGEHDLNAVIPDKTTYIDRDLKFLREELDDILKSFTNREREVLYMYFGIGKTRAHTLKEIGEFMHLTRERIRQIKESVLKKLRKKKLINRLKD